MKRIVDLFIIVLIISLVMCLSGCSCNQHSLKEEVITYPTCTTDGAINVYCVNCNYSREEVLPSSHDFQEELVLIEATCAMDGESVYKCSVCGEEETRTTFESHSYSGSTCIYCGYRRDLPELTVGMSKYSVELKWGEPIEVDKRTDSDGTTEVWWYKEDGKTIAVNFDVGGKVCSINEF